MLNYLYQYIAFFLESVTVVIAILVILIVFFGLIAKAKSAKKTGVMKVKALHEKLAQQKATLCEAVLSKKALKALHKIEKAELKSDKKQKKHRKIVYVIRFEGDLQASNVASLREEVNTILQVATSKDEVLVCVNSPGGVVHGYGLAAAQLERIRARKIPLTVAVDKVAASGGYMMACVADKILAAPFAIVGSIGVVMQVPNFYKLLDKHGVAFEQVTAGEYKRTLTLFGKNSAKDRQKAQLDVENMHTLFKNFIKQYRPDLDFKKAATGEYWHAIDAIKMGLVDEILTSDDYLLNLHEKSQAKLIEVQFMIKRSFGKKMSMSLKNFAGIMKA